MLLLLARIHSKRRRVVELGLAHERDHLLVGLDRDPFGDEEVLP